MSHLKSHTGRETEHFNGNLQVTERKGKPSIQPFYNSGERKTRVEGWDSNSLGLSVNRQSFKSSETQLETAHFLIKLRK